MLEPVAMRGKLLEQLPSELALRCIWRSLNEDAKLWLLSNEVLYLSEGLLFLLFKPF